VLLGDLDQVLDLRSHVWIVVGKCYKGYDLSPESLQCQAKMVRPSDATKRHDTLAFEGCEWQNVPIGQHTEVQRCVLAAEQGKI
jgi:hypothetical protein